MYVTQIFVSNKEDDWELIASYNTKKIGDPTLQQ